MIPRSAFAERLAFSLDPFQAAALDALDAGRSVLVAAPTGSGKTLVAEYAVTLALATGGKAFYTTPIKALSNQKYADLAAAHGAARVGLLTGDHSINGDAPVVVMTTEVLRNMIYAASPTLANLRYVVLDEVHYLQNRYRGPVWEEVIIQLAPDVDLVCLSATVSNAEELADWIRTVRGETAAVIEERRPVTLQHRYLVGERGSDGLHLLPTFVTADDGDPRPNPEATRLDGRSGGAPRRRRLRTPGRAETVERLAAERMLPAILFVFSRAGCDAAVDECMSAGLRLTTPDERVAIGRIAEARTRALSDADLGALGHGPWLAALEAGIATHHAGMVPPMKEAVEEAFAAGLVKAVFATETLALGINMPARTVVIEKLSKFTGERHEFLTPGEYTQLTGRAGRRGIDEVGYAVVCWSPFVPFDQVAGLASRRVDALTSSFRPTYNMAANLVRRHDPDVAHHLLNLSFAQYRADRDVVAMERRLERAEALFAGERDAATCERGDIGEYRRMVAAHRERPRPVPEALAALRPGDVLLLGRTGGRAVVLKHHHERRGGSRVLVLGADRELRRLGASDFDAPPRAVATIELPRPFTPRNPAFRRTAVDALRRVPVEDRRPRRGAAPPTDGPDPDHHPVAACPQLPAHLRAATAAERRQREVTRLRRRVRGRSENLARQFDRVLAVLDAWEYVAGWSLTKGGELLARIYSEVDLVVAEALRRGLLDGLGPPELAALVSCLTYERRGPDTAAPQPHWPSREVGRRAREIEQVWKDLVAAEDDAGLPETRAPDGHLAASVHAWVRGRPLAEVLDDELTGGDFVRHVRQCVDLLRQIAEVAPVPSTGSAAREAATACFRGVVAASSVGTA